MDSSGDDTIREFSVRGTVVSVLPLSAAAFAFGASLGVLAVAQGIPAWQVVLMSAVVFAGSAQFGALAVLAGGGSAVAAAATGVLLNLRYLPIGAAAAPSLPGGRVRRALLGQLIVDESYALGVVAGSPERPHGPTMLVVGAVLWVTWVGGTAVGAVLGPALGDPARFGLDAAFPAAFAALLWPLLGTRGAKRAALGGALVALVLSPFAPAGVVLAAAAVAGLVLRG